MVRKIDISLKKQPKQRRSLETIEALVGAAIYILKRDGPTQFTTHTVAEKAGVNIASFYQYFPNKQALLFHIVKMNWERDLARLVPILSDEGSSSAIRFTNFVREFFKMEAAEADFRRALRISSVDLQDTQEYKALIARGAQLTRQFIEGAIEKGKSKDLDFDVQFLVTLVTSFAERTTDRAISEAELKRQADCLAEMVISRYRIS